MTLVIFFILIIVAGSAFYWFGYCPNQKLEQIQSSGLIEVDGAELRYPDLPLGKFGIFFAVNSSRKVQVVFPKLTPDGQVEYIYSWHRLNAIHIPKYDKLDKPTKRKVQSAKELAMVIREHWKIEPEVSQLRAQWHKIDNLLKLVSTSDFYASQQEIYERALEQIERLLKESEKLEKAYLRYIRELLIGSQIAGYNPDLLEPHEVELSREYQRIREEYQHAKHTATAYGELVRTGQL